MADLARRQIDKIAVQRAKNRADFPQAAALMDAFAITKPRLIFAEEGGKSIGKDPEKK